MEADSTPGIVQQRAAWCTYARMKVGVRIVHHTIWYGNDRDDCGQGPLMHLKIAKPCSSTRSWGTTALASLCDLVVTIKGVQGNMSLSPPPVCESM